MALKSDRGFLASGVALVLAFLASQHHMLHMMVMTAGVGAAGMSFMTMYPVVRRLMLAMSLVAVGIAAYQVAQRHRPQPMRVMSGVSVVLTLGVLAWSVSEFGV
jgi:hypothetical protein